MERKQIKKIERVEDTRNKNWKTDLILRCQKDPVFFIEKVLGDSLWSRQKEICMAMIDNERVAVPACYSSDTEIMTETRGFQLFKDLLPEDKVASLVHGKMVFVKPTQYFEYDWDGEMVGYKGKSLDFLVTPNHMCYVRSQKVYKPFTLRRADEVYGKWLYFNKGDHDFDGVNEYEWTINDYELLGFWFGDGNLYYRDALGKQKRYRISITQSKYVDYLRDLINKSSFTFFETKRDHGGISFYKEDKELATWFRDNFYKDGKKSIPQWLKNSTKECLRAFIFGMAMADGSIFDTKSNRREWSCDIRFYGEELLAEDFYEIGVRAGFVVNKNVYLNKEEVRTVRGRPFMSHGLTCYCIRFHETTDGTVGKQYVPSAPKNWYKTHYTGKVYCVEVPSHIVFVRRNGISFWNGQSFGVGKTYIASRLLLWFLYCFPEAKVISTAPTLRQVKELLWSEVRHAHKKSAYDLGGELLQMMLKIDENQFAIGFSTDSENIDRFTGFHSPYQLVIFDQAGGIEPPLWEAAEGLMTSAHCRWLAISNTAISDCELANICIPERRTRFGTWKVITITAEESPNVVAGKNIIPGLIAHDWVKKREEAWGRDDPLYRVFVKAEFIPDAQMNVLPYVFINKAFESDGELGTEIEIGLDVARMGLDSTVWTAKSGSRVLEIKRVTGNDTMTVVGETIEFRRYLEEKYELSVNVCRIDVIGLGAGVYDRLIELDFPAQAVNNAVVQEVADKERYSNIRAEMAWSLRYRMEHLGVGLKSLFVTDWEIKDYVRGDLQVMKYKITSNGKIQIVAKEDIRKELGRSPDYWDSMVMAFEQPGGGPAQLEFISNIDKESQQKIMTEEEWNIFIGQTIPFDDDFFGVEYEIS